MFKKVTLIIFASLLVLSACTPGSTNLPASDTLPPSLPAPNDPVSSDDPALPGEDRAPWAPAPGDDTLGRAEVELSQFEILTLESFPPQFMLRLAGSMGNPCNQLRVEVAQPDDENRIKVEVYSLYDPAAMCVQTISTFDVNIPLGSFPAGMYTLEVNGKSAGQIVAP